MAKKKGEDISVEAMFEQMDEVLRALDGDEVSLEESFSLYQRGVKLVKECNEKIDKVEKQLLILGESLGGMEIEDEF